MSKSQWKNLPKEPVPPLRPPNGYGTLGRKITLTTNHFPVVMKNRHLTLFHYDVTIKDSFGKEDLPKRKKMSVFEGMTNTYPKVFHKPMGFDSQKNAYSTELFPQLSKKAVTYEVDLQDGPAPTAAGGAKKNGKRNTFTVTLIKVNQASLQELIETYSPKGGNMKEACNVIQMVEIMFRHFRAKRFEQIGSRSFFSSKNEFGNPFYVSGTKEGQVGFFASLRPSAWKDGLLTMNVDTSYAAFHKEIPILEFLEQEFHISKRDFNGPLSPFQIGNAEKALVGLRIRTLHSPIPRTYKVIGITKQTAKNITFTKTEGTKSTKMSVCDYFKKDLNINLQYPNFNCLHVGNPSKTNYLPIECCKIDKGQKVNKKLTDMETREFIKSTAIPPAERLRKIQDIVRVNNFRNDSALNSLSFQIADMPIRTEGRVLPAPPLLAVRRVDPRDGKWNANNFHKGSQLLHWTVLNYDNRTRMDDVNRFVDKIVQFGNQMGMVVSKPFDIYQQHSPNPEKDFEYYKKQNKDLQLVMCVLGNKLQYGDIKFAGDRIHRLITQCIMSKNVQRFQDTLVRNVLLKINAKMGGTHTVCGPNANSMDVVFFAKPVIVMGADVNHPPAGDSTKPSLVAVVGSMDQCAARYAVEVRAQHHRTEVILDMQAITKNLLIAFFKKTGRKPERIVMYRDGVSESQFEEVLANEMKKMRDACTQLEKTYTPGITFICVQKRHHTRLFCDQRDGVGRHKNVPPGTIVDRDVTHPKENDFFLVSHEGIQGTSRPTHYHVLWDDNDVPVNELQMMTYKLCHVYSRCTRAVSIPTPAYYAHLAAFRAKTHVDAYLHANSNKIKEGEELAKFISQQIVRTSSTDQNTLYNELYYV